jgi:hypothetical protein
MELTIQAEKTYHTLNQEDKEEFEKFNTDELHQFTRLSENIHIGLEQEYIKYVMFQRQRGIPHEQDLSYGQYCNLLIANQEDAKNELKRMFSVEAKIERQRRLQDKKVEAALLGKDLKNEDILSKYSRFPVLDKQKPRDKDKEIER